MKMKKVIAILLTACMLFSILAACGNDEGNPDAAQSGTESSTGTVSQTGAFSLPLTDEKEDLTVWAVYSGTIMSDLNEIEGVKEMERLTGVHINWTPINQDETSEKLGIMLSAGNYPDIIYPASISYPGGIEKGVSDGVIYEDHDTLIHQNMPHYMAYLDANEQARREATSDSGKMNCIKVIVGGDGTAESEGTYQGLAYRADLLSDLGLDIPTTIDEWHDALTEAKKSGIEYPFMLDTNGGSAISLSWGVSPVSPNADYLQLDGDTVVSGVLTDGYGDYLDTMRQWYAEGLIDPNFTSFNYYLDTPASVESNGALLYSLILSAFTGNNYYRMKMVSNESEFLQPIVAPALKNGDAPIQSAERIIAKDSIFISTSCENPELAARWLDFLYSEQGEQLLWYGIEGTTYELDDAGIPQFTDFVLDHPDGAPAAEILERYCLNQGNCWLGKHNTYAGTKISTAAAGGVNQQMEAVNIWSEPAVNISMPGRSLTPTDAEGDAINSKLTAITTLIEEHTINYIIGESDRSFEDFKAQLLQYGYQDIIDTYQNVYDRYMAR